MDLHSLKELVAIDSPSGFTHKAAEYIFNKLTEYGCSPIMTNKGAVKCAFSSNPTLGIAGHIDTLGAVVKEINSDGTLRISKVGELSLNACEGAYCKIYTLDDHIYTGTLLLDNPAIHVNEALTKPERTTENMHVRLDELVDCTQDVERLGIAVGDFICFEVKYEELPSGFIRSRFMDNKAGCFVLLELAKELAGKDVPVELFFSNYEEVGHGAATGFADSLEELLVIDMGVVGDGCTGKETHCSICAKDSSGPYDYLMRKTLTLLAQKNSIPHKVDVYPYYGSDGSAALRAGCNFRVGLIGPGVSASHGTERTHKQGIKATIDLCMAYIGYRFV